MRLPSSCRPGLWLFAGLTGAGRSISRMAQAKGCCGLRCPLHRPLPLELCEHLLYMAVGFSRASDPSSPGWTVTSEASLEVVQPSLPFPNLYVGQPCLMLQGLHQGVGTRRWASLGHAQGCDRSDLASCCVILCNLLILHYL